MTIAQKITALTELAKGIPESLLVAVDDPNNPGKKTKKFGFGTFLKTYNRSAAEISLGLSNDDLDFKNDFVNVLRYGTGITSIQTAINVVSQEGGGYVDVPEDTYAFGTTTLTMKSNVHVRGAGRNGTFFTYSGAGIAIDMFGVSHAAISQFKLDTSNDVATGVRIGNGSRHCQIITCFIQGTNTSTNTGAGLLLDGTGAIFSGGLYLNNIYVLGHKFGIQITGDNINVGTWTTVTGVNLWLIGRSAGIISGSRGIEMDGFTNGVGCSFMGVDIESQAVGFKHVNNGFGAFVEGDFEGNTVNFETGLSFNGYIKVHPGGETFQGASNLTANLWMKEKHFQGVITQETRKGTQHVIYDDVPDEEHWQWFRGDSIIDGNSPRNAFMINVSNSTDVEEPSRNFLKFRTHKMAWGATLPFASGEFRTWRQGDVVWKTDVAAGGSPGWLCTASGTFSTATDATGDTDGSTAVITGMTDTSGFNGAELDGPDSGDFVTVSAGFPVGPIEVLSKTATTLTLATNSTSAQTNVTVSTPNPIFTVMGGMEAVNPYTPTNITTDRSYDANAAVSGTGIDVAAAGPANVALLSDHDALVAVVQELADVVGTMIADHQGQGIFK